MEQTGHRSLEGVREYKRTSLRQKEQLSDILNSTRKDNTNPTLPISNATALTQHGQQEAAHTSLLESTVAATTLATDAGTSSLVPSSGNVTTRNEHTRSLSVFQNMIMPPSAFNFNSCTITINNYHAHTSK